MCSSSGWFEQCVFFVGFFVLLNKIRCLSLFCLGFFVSAWFVLICYSMILNVRHLMKGVGIMNILANTLTTLALASLCFACGASTQTNTHSASGMTFKNQGTDSLSFKTAKKAAPEDDAEIILVKRCNPDEQVFHPEVEILKRGISSSVVQTHPTGPVGGPMGHGQSFSTSY